MTNEELLEARIQAWAEWNSYEYQVYQPRSYKLHRKFINPWTSTEELKEAMAKRAEYSQKYYTLNNECYDRELPELVVDFIWYEEQTPDGRRYRRRDGN